MRLKKHKLHIALILVVDLVWLIFFTDDVAAATGDWFVRPAGGNYGKEDGSSYQDAWDGLYRVEDLARIYVMVGEFDAAIDQLEFLLSITSELSIPLLRLDPAWDPLRDDLRFKKLIESGK